MSTDRILGMLQGVAVGDALGAPHEFKHQRNCVYTGSISQPVRLFNRFSGETILPTGSITDDTEMTLTLARSLVAHNGYNHDATISGYLTWANSQLTLDTKSMLYPMLGRNTRDLFRGVSTLRGYTSRLAKNDKTSQSNGSLMRASPLAVMGDFESVLADCNSTNPNDVNRDASCVYVMALRYLLLAAPPSHVYAHVATLVQTSPLQQVFVDIDAGTARNIIENKGWVAHAFYCAMFALKNAAEYASSNIYNAIISQFGDTDTNAAIAGAILGAYHGASGLMRDEVTALNIDRVMAANSNHTRRPSQYQLTDLEEVATTLSAIAAVSLPSDLIMQAQTSQTGDSTTSTETSVCTSTGT